MSPPQTPKVRRGGGGGGDEGIFVGKGGFAAGGSDGTGDFASSDGCGGCRSGDTGGDSVGTQFQFFLARMQPLSMNSQRVAAPALIISLRKNDVRHVALSLMWKQN